MTRSNYRKAEATISDRRPLAEPNKHIFSGFVVEAFFSPPKVGASGRTIYRNYQPTIWGRLQVAAGSTIGDKNERFGHP